MSWSGLIWADLSRSELIWSHLCRQCFILVSTPPFTAMLYLGFNVFLHFNALSHFNAWLQFHAPIHIGAEVASSVFMFFFSICLPQSHFNVLSHFNALLWFQRFPSLQCLILGSTLPSLQCFISRQCLTSISHFPSLRRRGHIECDHDFFTCLLQSHFNASSWFQCLILVSMLYFTSMLHFSFTLPVISTPRSHRVWPCFF